MQWYEPRVTSHLQRTVRGKSYGFRLAGEASLLESLRLVQVARPAYAVNCVYPRRLHGY